MKKTKFGNTAFIVIMVVANASIFSSTPAKAGSSGAELELRNNQATENGDGAILLGSLQDGNSASLYGQYYFLGANAVRTPVSSGAELGVGWFGRSQVGEHDDRKVTYAGFVGVGQRSTSDGKLYLNGAALKGYVDVELVRKFVDLELSGSFGFSHDGSPSYYKETGVGLPFAVARNIKIVPELRYATLAIGDISRSSKSANVSLRVSLGN